MVYIFLIVIYGRGVGVVVVIGMDIEVGNIVYFLDL